MKLSIVIPAHNEEQNIDKCLDQLRETIGVKYGIPYEIVVVNDSSRDGTESIIRRQIDADDGVRIVNRLPPGGFGRAVRAGIEAATGDVIVIYMADLSDNPEDVVAYYRKIEEGYDCVFGSRFTKGSVVQNYPKFKLIVNRIINRCIQLMFFMPFNDVTNAFKAYRAEVIHDCGPYRASHFNITIEMSLSAVIRKYNIAQIPISWHGRTWGSSNLSLSVMGRKYLCTLLMMFFQRLLIKDDLMAERMAKIAKDRRHVRQLEDRVEALENKYEELAPAIQVDGPSQVANHTALEETDPINIPR